MIRFLAGVVVGVLGLAAAAAWVVLRPIRIELAPPYPAREPWGDQ